MNGYAARILAGSMGAALGVGALWTCGCVNADLYSETRWEERATDSEQTDSATATDTADGDGPVDVVWADDTAPPTPVGVCSDGEAQVAPGICAVAGILSACVRVQVDEPATATLSAIGGSASWAAVWNGVPEEASGVLIALGGAAAGQATCEVALRDRSGNAQVVPLSVSLDPGVPVGISEVLPNPEGPEPDEEYVELVNWGFADVDVAGWMVDDGEDADGQPFPPGTTIPARGFLLVVGPGFPEDVQVPVVRLPSAVGTNGLKNSAPERIVLYDASGVVQDELVPAFVPDEGQVIAKIPVDAPAPCARWEEAAPSPGSGRWAAGAP